VVRGQRLSVLFLALASAVVLLATPHAAAKEKESSVYLAVGDSIAAGEGASDPASTAYVPLFHQFLQSKDGPRMV
jgi:hypothetical protein